MRASRLGLPLSTPKAAEGWHASPLVRPSGVVSANGLRFGPDRRLYIAQAFGSQVTALDLKTGELDLISGSDADLVSPDDLAFDSRGNMFVTELMNNRVSVRRPDGKVEVVGHNIPVANGLTVYQDRVIVSEYRQGGRLLEIVEGSQATRIIADDLMYPNALSVGPDGFVYFPLAIPGGEIWRTSLEGGTLERIAVNLNVPTAVKFGADGTLFFTEAGSGTLNAIDLRTKQQRVLATTMPGVDNLDFEDNETVVISNWADGSITRINAGTGSKNDVLAGSMLGPFGLAARSDGALVAADGLTTAVIGTDGLVERPIVLVQPDAPPWMLGVAVGSNDSLAFTSPGGGVCTYRFGEGAKNVATDLDQPAGVAMSGGGDVLVCEAGAGRIVSYSSRGEFSVLAKALQRPLGICIGPDDRIFASDADAGVLLEIEDGQSPTVLMRGLQEPHGVAAAGENLFVFDAGSGTLHAFNRRSGIASVIVSGLPSQGQLAARRNILPGVPGGPMAGPLFRFNGVAAFPDGRLCVACEADGSIWEITRVGDRTSAAQAS